MIIYQNDAISFDLIIVMWVIVTTSMLSFSHDSLTFISTLEIFLEEMFHCTTCIVKCTQIEISNYIWHVTLIKRANILYLIIFIFHVVFYNWKKIIPQRMTPHFSSETCHLFWPQYSHVCKSEYLFLFWWLLISCLILYLKPIVIFRSKWKLNSLTL